MGAKLLIRPKGPVRKRFGQHFLEPAWADKVVAAIDPQPGDHFLEIGPGQGVLTLRLAPRVAHLTAIEIDRDLTSALSPRLPANVDLIEGDVLEVDLGPIVAEGSIRVAGNLPYNISSPILFRLIDACRGSLTARAAPGPAHISDAANAGSPECPLPRAPAAGPRRREPAKLVDATLMVQREVAARIEGRPGTRDYGVLAISVQLYADVRRVLTLPPGAFRPEPKVHSAVVRLTFRPPAVDLRNHELFAGMVRTLFTRRRKMLGNALAPFAGSHGLDAREVLEAIGIEAARRAETLELAELAAIANHLAGRSDERNISVSTAGRR
jgi:16S rRNA (adenine1518-N6/adenine1519-N6)-dimethyltransferase